MLLRGQSKKISYCRVTYALSINASTKEISINKCSRQLACLLLMICSATNSQDAVSYGEAHIYVDNDLKQYHRE